MIKRRQFYTPKLKKTLKYKYLKKSLPIRMLKITGIVRFRHLKIQLKYYGVYNEVFDDPMKR